MVLLYSLYVACHYLCTNVWLEIRPGYDVILSDAKSQLARVCTHWLVVQFMLNQAALCKTAEKGMVLHA